MSIDNKNPYLGTFFYSPMYFYVKKTNGEISEISIIDPPSKWDDFMGAVINNSGLGEKLEPIKIKPRQQVMMHYNQSDLNENFDIDFDLKEEEAEPTPTEEAKPSETT